MKLSEIVTQLNMQVFSNEHLLDDIEVVGAYTSDLLSDVMGNAHEMQIWITLQNHKNVLAVASLKDMAAILLINGIKPGDELIEQSKKEEIPLLGTDEPAFIISGKLYNLFYK
ncbi:MAG: serine kinase [Bacteroidales bacterium]|nr:serine kinase [Bacteroidales bacterium]